MLDVIGLVIYSSSNPITGHPFPFPKAGLYYGGIDVSSLSSNVHYCCKLPNIPSLPFLLNIATNGVDL